MTALVFLVVSAFPLDLDGGLAPIEGRGPQLVVVAGAPNAVWLDPRRRWLDPANGEALYTAVLPDGGPAPQVTVALSNTAPLERDGFALAGGVTTNQLLVVWEARTAEGLWTRNYRLREGATVRSSAITPPGASARPLAAAWSGVSGLVAWRGLDGGSVVTNWVLPGGGMSRGFVLESATTALAVSPDDAGTSMLVASLVDGGVFVRRVPFQTTFVPDAGPGTALGSHLAVDPRGRVLLVQTGPSTRLLTLGSVVAASLDGGRMVAGRPWVDLTTSGQKFAALPTANGIELWLEQGAMDVSFLLGGRSVALATLDERAVVAVETVSGELELRSVTPSTGTLETSQPVPLSVVGAMRGSPGLAWATDRWVLAWEQRGVPAGPTRLASVLPDASVTSVSPSYSGQRPQLGVLEDGGLVLSAVGNGLVQSFELSPELMRGALMQQTGPLAVVLARCPGLVAVSPTSWNRPGSFPQVVPTGFTVEASACLEGTLWLVVRSAAEWKLQVLDVMTGITLRDVPLQPASPAPFAPRQAVVSARRTLASGVVVLVGIREGPDMTWSVFDATGTAWSPGDSTDSTRRGIAVTPVGDAWVASESFFVEPAGPGVVRSFLVDDRALFVPLPDLSFGAVEPGIPLLASGRSGEVGLAVPVLVDGDPRLRFTVLQVNPGGPRDGGPSMDGGGVDAGVMADAGPAVDAGVIEPDAGALGDAGVIDAGVIVPDAGVIEPDAGMVDGGVVEPDAGTGADGGIDPDAGVVSGDAGPGADGGAAGPQPIFVPVACGCEAVDVVMGLPLALLLLRRRRRARPAVER